MKDLHHLRVIKFLSMEVLSKNCLISTFERNPHLSYWPYHPILLLIQSMNCTQSTVFSLLLGLEAIMLHINYLRFHLPLMNYFSYPIRKNLYC